VIFFKIGEFWQSYKQERGCLVQFARLANTLLKDEDSARNNHVLACNFAKYSPIKKKITHIEALSNAATRLPSILRVFPYIQWTSLLFTPIKQLFIEICPLIDVCSSIFSSIIRLHCVLLLCCTKGAGVMFIH